VTVTKLDEANLAQVEGAFNKRLSASRQGHFRRAAYGPPNPEGQVLHLLKAQGADVSARALLLNDYCAVYPPLMMNSLPVQ
jgi:hypothetical protein